MISSLSRAYERTEEMQKRGIFANLFLLQNRLQALFDHDPRNLGVTLKQCCGRIRAMGAPCAWPFRRLPNSILPKAPPSTAKCWIRCLPAIPPKSFCPCIG